MSYRYLVIATDGETITKTISVSDHATALLQLSAGETLVSLDAAVDTGAFINDATVKIDLTGPVPTFVNVSDGLPVADTGLTDLEMEEVQ